MHTTNHLNSRCDSSGRPTLGGDGLICATLLTSLWSLSQKIGAIEWTASFTGRRGGGRGGGGQFHSNPVLVLAYTSFGVRPFNLYYNLLVFRQHNEIAFETFLQEGI